MYHTNDLLLSPGSTLCSQANSNIDVNLIVDFTFKEVASTTWSDIS